MLFNGREAERPFEKAQAATLESAMHICLQLGVSIEAR
jgi:hypothetical protein